MANSVRVGDVEIISIVDSFAVFQASFMYPDVPEESWRELAPEVAGAGTVRATMGCFVVRAPRRTVLVDSGIGPAGAPDHGIDPGRLPDALREAGLSADDIDVVAITHLHIDHVGWNAQQRDGRVQPTFSKARYYLPRGDYDFFTSSEQIEQNPFLRTQAVALVEAGVAELYTNEQRLADELTLIPTPGHTPGHASIAITSGGEQGFILGDLAHHPAQIAHPDVRAVFDVDQDMAQRSREAMIARVAELGAKVAAGHFPPPGFGRVVVTEGRRMWQGV